VFLGGPARRHLGLARRHAAEQVIDRDGFVNVPFAGKIAAAGKSLPEIEQEVARRLKGKANQPECLCGACAMLVDRDGGRRGRQQREASPSRRAASASSMRWPPPAAFASRSTR
jgi:hypothetical protein